MRFTGTDFGSALRRIADQRIEEAMSDGLFDNLAGAGKPVNLDPLPPGENARAAWWALRIMKKNEFTPHEVQYRKQLDDVLQRIDIEQTDVGLVRLVRQANELVHRINTLGTNALTAPVVTVDLERERQAMSRRATP